MGTELRNRSTPDLVVLILTAVVGLSILIGMVGLMSMMFFRPEEDLAGNFRVLADVITVIVGAIVGYIGGRAVRRSETPSGPHSEE